MYATIALFGATDRLKAGPQLFHPRTNTMAKKPRKKSSKPVPANRRDRPTETHPETVASTEPVASDTEPSQPVLPVAGIGASAGGLDAFKKFFAAMPADSGVAFVLIPHLDPMHESLMVELIGRQTRMPVAEAADGTVVEANNVYILPPNKYMTISGGVLRLSGPINRDGPQTSIDLFMRSLAEDKQDQAICIILSGTGTHGAMGLKAVKAAGGMAMVQDPDTAYYAAMPRSAIATELADYVLPAEEMPAALIKYVRDYCAKGLKSVAEEKRADDDLNQVLALLRARGKLDFRQYRKKMLARRVERRISLGHFDHIADYLSFLRDHPDELQQLSRDLLISVTCFFRDPNAWEVLATQVIAPLVRAKEPDAPIRVWCTGCATGEEPYSIGILLLEQLAATQKVCPIQIFATDVDDNSLNIARQGVYPESISADVSPERLLRYFTRVSDSSYQVSKQLRETVIFARQNLISDAPFSKLDLVVCRNLLIYLEPDLQKKVIALLHLALNEGGWLFLGSSETIGRNVDLFEQLSSKWRIYRRIGPSRAANVQFFMAQPEPHHGIAPMLPDKPLAPPRLSELAQDFMLRRFALACVVINRNYEVLNFAGPTEDYLVQPGGPPTHDLLSLARPGLQTKLRVIIQRAIRENSAQSIKDVMMRHGSASRRVNIDVEPLARYRKAEGLWLVVFQEQPIAEGETLDEAKDRLRTSESDMMVQLEQELEATREDLQSTIEELESSNEELKASNEEIMSMNEELQSANEELETSKEELQSLNEELSTVNFQLQDKVQDLEATNNDISNLLNCTDIATVFLDSRFYIRRFTPAATRLFSLIPTDVGRSIGDIAKRFDDDDLLADAERFLLDLKPREREVCLDDGSWCIRRINPYRTHHNRIDGIVFTFVDITERKLAADTIVSRLATIVESSADAIFSKDLDGTVRTWNKGAERLYGYTAGEMIGQSIRRIVPDDRLQEWTVVMAALQRGESIQQLETERVCKDGQCMPVALTYSPIRNADGKVICVSAIARDITDRKAAEEALKDREARLRAILNNAYDAIITIDRNGVVQSVNPAAEQMFGYAAAEMVGQNVSLIMPSPYREEHDRYMANYLKTGEARIIGIGREAQARRKDGSVFPIDLTVSEIKNLQLFTGMIRDITRRKALEREVVEIASLEQQRISSDLHDTVGQELTALNMLAKDLSESIDDSAVRAKLVERVSRGLQRCQLDLRVFIRGLLPVEIDQEGLSAALAELASRVEQEGNVACIFHCPVPIDLRDTSLSTNLYYIAQEAVHNALKHSKCHKIRITLTETGRGVVLSICDDGIGMPAKLPEKQGVGLQIMRNRAAINGAQLKIEPVKPSGTVVTCTWVGTNYAVSHTQKTQPSADRG